MEKTEQALKILVVEDNPVNQKVVKILLEKSGYSYELAQDGLQACELYTQKNFDLILMDCQMPNLNGLEASEKIRSIEINQTRKRCPIVAMTANAMKGDRERCLSAGMDDFLAKPFKGDDLYKIISSWTLRQ